jgi:hypothetical protein
MHAHFSETFVFSYTRPLARVKDEGQKASEDNSKGSKSDYGKPMPRRLRRPCSLARPKVLSPTSRLAILTNKEGSGCTNHFTQDAQKS